MWHIIQPNGHYQGYITVVPPKRQAFSFHTEFVDGVGTAISISRREITKNEGQGWSQRKVSEPCQVSAPGVVDAFRNMQLLAPTQIAVSRILAVSKQGREVFELPFN